MSALPVLVLLMLAASGSDAAPIPVSPAKPPPKPKAKPVVTHPTGLLEPPDKPKPSTPVKPQVVTPTPAPKKKTPVVPVSWPVAAPKDLPAFPSGWEPDVPPPAAVTARAWQLLQSLWKSGKPGATTVEQTGGRWITYQAAVPSAGKRGVVAWRIKGNPPAGSLPAKTIPA